MLNVKGINPKCCTYALSHLAGVHCVRPAEWLERLRTTIAGCMTYSTLTVYTNVCVGRTFLYSRLCSPGLRALAAALASGFRACGLTSPRGQHLSDCPPNLQSSVYTELLHLCIAWLGFSQVGIIGALVLILSNKTVQATQNQRHT